jgi:hypothetical protein|tara:strand:+ start:1043 stop:1612 length:570 start_codon:yes stop_codon:yes gene_type:complete
MAIFWNDVQMDPKRQFRFVLRFPLATVGLKVPEFVIKTVSKPKVTISSIPHTFVDHEFKFPGRVTWDPVTLTLVDPGNDTEDMAQVLMNKLGKSGYNYPNSVAHSLASMSKEKASNAVGQVQIAQLDDRGQDTEVWTLTNPFITSMDFGGLDYSSDELSEITIELTYDWATLNNSVTGPAKDKTPTMIR